MTTKSRRLLAFLPFAIVGIVHLGGQLTSAADVLTVTKPLLMPALLVAVLVSLPRPWGRAALWAGVAIVFSWFGDIALMLPGDTGFLSGLAFFLLAHVFYLVLILRVLRLRRVPFVALAYAGWWIVLIALLQPHTGWLVWPLAAYGLVLGAMAASALSANGWVAAGGAVFLVSDTVLGLNRFLPGFELVQVDFVIMLSYLAGQGLIAWGAVTEKNPRAASPGPRPAGSRIGRDDWSRRLSGRRG